MKIVLYIQHSKGGTALEAKQYDEVDIIANSMGAYFSMLALGDKMKQQKHSSWSVM